MAPSSGHLGQDRSLRMCWLDPEKPADLNLLTISYSTKRTMLVELKSRKRRNSIVFSGSQPDVDVDSYRNVACYRRVYSSEILKIFYPRKELGWEVTAM